MDSHDMSLLNEIYIRILKKGRSIYDKSMENVIINAQNLESYSTYLNEMNEKLESILDLTEKYSNECIEKATEIRKYVEINNKYKDDSSRMIHAHKEMYSGLSWADVTDVEDAKEKILNNVDKIIVKPVSEMEFKQTPILYKDISNIYGKDIGFNCKIPIINKLNEIPSAFYWYAGDKNNPKGIYICISRKFYVQIPFPNIIDGTRDFNRKCSIKCKYESKEECLKLRTELANRYNSSIRECNFAHKGEKYVRVGTTFRCPTMPHFGRHSSLKNDLENLPDYDIKMMLLNALSDIFISKLWFQRQKNDNLILNNIDTC
jgi:hypothetical protein